MFKTMNKGKKIKKPKEKKELKKGTKKCLPSNVEGICLFFMYIILFHRKMIKVLERSIYLCLTLNTIAVCSVKIREI